MNNVYNVLFLAFYITLTAHLYPPLIRIENLGPFFGLKNTFFGEDGSKMVAESEVGCEDGALHNKRQVAYIIYFVSLIFPRFPFK